MRSGAMLRYYPGKLVGIRFEYNVAFIAAFKAAVPVKMWDPLSKTWWFPEDYLTVVEQLWAQCGGSTNDFVNFKQLAVREKPADAYATLGLLPGAPLALIEHAYQFWKRQFNTLGTGSKLVEIEEAYLALKGEEAA